MTKIKNIQFKQPKSKIMQARSTFPNVSNQRITFNYQNLKNPSTYIAFPVANRQAPSFTFAQKQFRQPSVIDYRNTRQQYVNGQPLRYTPTFGYLNNTTQNNQNFTTTRMSNYKNYEQYATNVVNNIQPNGLRIQTKNISENSRFKLQNIPDAKQQQFRPGCFKTAQKGIVFQSHEVKKSSSCC